MNKLTLHNSVTMSSVEIAELTEKDHKHVIRDIRVMIKELEKDGPILGHHESLDNRGYTSSFILNRELTETLITGYSIGLRYKVIQRLHELEGVNKAPVFVAPKTMAEALRLAADQAEQLELAAPKVAFVDKYVTASGNKGFRETAKLLSINETEFRDFLIDNKIMYRLNDALTGFAQHIDAGRITTKATIDAAGKARNQALFTPKGVEWVAGLIAKSKARELL